jgi:hypothetical protein
MSRACPTACRTCGKASDNGTSYCKLHVADSRIAARAYDKFVRAKDEIAKLYHTTLWRRFRDSILARNPICALIVNGVQCTHAATLVHHIISPRQRRDLFTTASNVAPLCADHHTDEEGENMEARRKFAPTIDMFGTAHEIKTGAEWYV